MDKEFAEAFKEEIELDEMKWAVGGVYHQEFKNGDKVYFRADSVQKNKRWKGMSVDEFGGRQKKAKNASADEKAQGWETTPKNEIPKGLKEEVELDEGKFKKGDIVIPNIGPHKGEKHTIIHDFKNGSYNISLNKKHSRYDQGAAKAKENQLKLVKEEVELDEFYTVFAVRHKEKDGKRYVIPFKTQQKADKKAKELKSAGATEIEVEKIILKGNIKWKEEVEIDEKVSAISLGHGENALKTARIKYKRGSDGFVVAKKDLGKAKEIVSKSFRSFLKSRSPMSTGDHDLPKVTAEEVEIEEARKAAKDIGLECQECGKRFRSANPRYGITKCPKCKSTDLDLAYGEEVEIDEVKYVLNDFIPLTFDFSF